MKASMLAEAAGCHVETIRYYEKIGLLPRPERTASGYRAYRKEDAQRLRFIVRSRALGFSLEDVRSFLTMADMKDSPCEGIDDIARKHLAQVEVKQAELAAMATELRRMLKACHHGNMAECTILQTLVG